MYLATPFTPSTEALNKPGANELSTSAITAMWISVGVIPTSVALGFSLLVDCAPATADVPTNATATAAPSATQRTFFIAFPL
jgi:hypothetical protein